MKNDKAQQKLVKSVIMHVIIYLCIIGIIVYCWPSQWKEIFGPICVLIYLVRYKPNYITG